MRSMRLSRLILSSLSADVERKEEQTKMKLTYEEQEEIIKSAAEEVGVYGCIGYMHHKRFFFSLGEKLVHKKDFKKRKPYFYTNVGDLLTHVCFYFCDRYGKTRANASLTGQWLACKTCKHLWSDSAKFWLQKIEKMLNLMQSKADTILENKGENKNV